MSTNPPLIQCENLVKIYQVEELEVVALQGLDLEIAAGEFLAIVGASGSGKSSLLNMLGGLDVPSAGRISVAGQNLLKLSSKELARYRREQVGFVWQQASRNLIPYLTALENVELPMLTTGLGARHANAQDDPQGHPQEGKRNDLDAQAVTTRAHELLAAVEMAERSHHRLAQLSGGQQQRVAIAVALANQPNLLLADEPTGEVDTATAHQIWRVLRELNQRYGLTTVIVSHDRDIAQFVDRVVHIRDGRTSSETIRQHQPAATAAERDPAGSTPDLAGHFEERTVLDSAGRLQLPRDYLIQHNFQSRAVVQLVEEGILIRPTGAAGQRAAAAPSPAQISAPEVSETEVHAAAVPASRWQRWLPRWGRGQQASPSTPATAHFVASPPVANDTPLVKTVDLRRVYAIGAEEVEALRAVNLTINRGEFVIFRGRSGSGKTTLLNLIGGLDQPTSGHVQLWGERLDRLSDPALTQLRQEHIGFVFQSFALIPTFSALENVEMVLRAAQVDEQTRYACAMYCLTLVGLRSWVDHRPFELSGGQQQRLSIARALARHPTMLIADEPTSDLDSETGAQILQLFQRLVTEEGITILMSSHDPLSAAYASQVYALQDGQIVN